MKKSVSLTAGRAFILFSGLALGSVSVMALVSPQSVMDLVHVELNNNDAISSIRGIYGGLGVAIVISLIYLAFIDVMKGLAFLAMLWGFYAFSRLITLFNNGPLGSFGNNWMILEAIFCMISLGLMYWNRKSYVIGK